MLAWARRLVRLADAMEQAAERARLRELPMAMHATRGNRELAELDADARSSELFLEFRLARDRANGRPAARSDVRAVLTAEPAD